MSPPRTGRHRHPPRTAPRSRVKAAVKLLERTEASDGLADELMAYCRKRLAGYKAPKSIDFVDALLRHPNGKLYKRLLPDPDWEGHDRKI